jgi:uncharacterized protein YcfL
MKYAKPIGLLLLLMLAVSCAPTTTPQTGFDSMAQHNKIIYIRQKGQTYTLSRYLKVVKDVLKRTDTGLLTGIVVFNNNSSDHPNLLCDVQFVFLDDTGIELEKTNWQPIMFPQGVDKAVKQVAINPTAQDYRVYVRAARSPY